MWLTQGSLSTGRIGWSDLAVVVGLHRNYADLAGVGGIREIDCRTPISKVAAIGREAAWHGTSEKPLCGLDLTEINTQRSLAADDRYLL